MSALPSGILDISDNVDDEKNTVTDEDLAIPRDSEIHILDNQLFETLGSTRTKTIDELADLNLDHKPLGRISVEPKEYKTHDIKHDEGVYCIKWSPDGQLMAVGCSDGDVRVLTRSGKFYYHLRTVGNMPCTSIRWKPGTHADHTLIASNASGHIQYWHVQSQKSIYSIHEEDNQVFTLDYRKDGKVFASGGSDRAVRIYDDETKKIICKMERGYIEEKPGHSNRVFSVKFKPDDPNILVSGSWDNTVLFWDIRSGSCFRQIFGPHIAGHAIDIQNDVLVTGSWRSDDTVQTWEFATGRNIKTLAWDRAPMVYSLSFAVDRENIIAAGGTGVNCVRLIDISTGVMSQEVELPEQAGVYSLDFDPTGTLLAVAGQSSTVSLYSMKNVKADDILMV